VFCLTDFTLDPFLNHHMLLSVEVSAFRSVRLLYWILWSHQQIRACSGSCSLRSIPLIVSEYCEPRRDYGLHGGILIPPTGFGAHPASSHMFPRGISGRTVKLTTHVHLMMRSRMMELYIHSPIFMAWCLVKHRDNFTFLPLCLIQELGMEIFQMFIPSVPSKSNHRNVKK
jgi:hypothetical protein